ncbi:unnamed protein product [Musa hybrid cultivar]
MSRHATALCSTIPNQYVPSLVSDMPFPCVWAMRRRCKKVQIRSHKTLPTAVKAGSTSDDEPLHSPDPEGVGKKGTMLAGDDLEVVSLRTMAQETLGVWGGNLATVAYLFLGYTCVVAYTSKSGEVLSHLIGLPASTLQPLHAPRGTAHTGRWHDHHRPSESMADRHNDRFGCRFLSL